MAAQLCGDAFCSPARATPLPAAAGARPSLALGGQAAPGQVATHVASESVALAAVVGAGVGATVTAARRQRKQQKKAAGGPRGKPATVVSATETASFYDVVEGSASSGVAGRELQETAQDRVFHWLGKAPKPGTPCFTALQKYFPGALPSKAVHNRTKAVLEEDFGFKPETTLLGSSFCPDEINNQEKDLATLMREHYGKIFPMGGIGGSPYVGETGFAAFSSHVSDEGDIIVVFGPHVGISEAGDIGKYLREGQSGLSTACGAVIGAYNACLSSTSAATPEMDEADMQMSEIKQEFTPHAAAISETENPMASCAYQAFEMVKDRMEKIVNTKFGSGRLVLIGGIQINMPYPEFDDHFLPLTFEVRQEGKDSMDLMDRFTNLAIQQDLKRSPWAASSAQREVFAWMTWSPPPVSPVYQTMHKYFPGALPGQAVHKRAIQVLAKYGFTDDNTLLGTSVCPDEINNESPDLPVLMQDYWGEVFPMGGISGTPFSGKTGFVAFSSHVAEDGHILCMFGPHVGISESGEVGQCLRPGQANQSTACGAVIGAYNACMGGDTGEAGENSYDLQMDFVKRQIAPHAQAISKTESPMAALAHQSYDMVREQMFIVVNNDFGNGYLCLLGGIQINLPDPMEDHFYPVTFELRRAGEPTIDLIAEMKEFY